MRKEIIARYPEGRQVSAVIPLLDLAQRQVGAETNTQGWLPIPVMEFVARELDKLVHPHPRGRDLLHDVQPGAGRPLPRPGVRDDAMHAAGFRRRVHGLRQARAEEGKNDRGRAFHFDRGRVPRRLRQRADGADQRRQLRGSDRGEHGRDPRRACRRPDAEARARRSTARRAARSAARRRSRKWPSAITITVRCGRRRRPARRASARAGRGRRRGDNTYCSNGSLPAGVEGRVHERRLKIIVAIVIVIAWKILKGLIGLLVGVAVAGLVVYGAYKLIDGGQKRLK